MAQKRRAAGAGMDARLAATLAAMTRDRPVDMAAHVFAADDARLFAGADAAREDQIRRLTELMWASAASLNVARTLAATLRAAGDKAAAEILLAISDRGDATARDHRNAAFAMGELGRKADALACWARVRSADPADPDAPTRIERLRPQADYAEMRARAQTRRRRPSFAYKAPEQMRLDEAASKAGVRDPTRDLGLKEVSHPWVVSLGVRAPARLARLRLADFTEDNAPERFVIKPTDSHSGRGVRLLRRSGGEYSELRSSQSKPICEWREELRQDMQRYAFADDWFIEDLLTAADGRDAVPNSVKFFAFFGRIGCIFIRETEGLNWRERYFAADWTPVRAHPLPICNDENVSPPRRADLFLATATRMSAAIRRPFMRLDFYDAAGGLAFGECTPHPGWYEDFTDEWDERLGEFWEDAEVRLKA